MSKTIDVDLLEKTLRKDGWTQNATEYILNAVDTHEAYWEVVKELTHLHRNWGGDTGPPSVRVADILRKFTLKITMIIENRKSQEAKHG